MSFLTPRTFTAWKVSKYGIYSGPFFPVFELNTGKYGAEKTPYLDTFPAVFSTAWNSWKDRNELGINVLI